MRFISCKFLCVILVLKVVFFLSCGKEIQTSKTDIMENPENSGSNNNLIESNTYETDLRNNDKEDNSASDIIDKILGLGLLMNSISELELNQDNLKDNKLETLNAIPSAIPSAIPGLTNKNLKEETNKELILIDKENSKIYIFELKN